MGKLTVLILIAIFNSNLLVITRAYPSLSIHNTLWFHQTRLAGKSPFALGALKIHGFFNSYVELPEG